jgi:hypothetical protein
MFVGQGERIEHEVSWRGRKIGGFVGRGAGARNDIDRAQHRSRQHKGSRQPGHLADHGTAMVLEEKGPGWRGARRLGGQIRQNGTRPDDALLAARQLA